MFIGFVCRDFDFETQKSTLNLQVCSASTASLVGSLKKDGSDVVLLLRKAE